MRFGVLLILFAAAFVAGAAICVGIVFLRVPAPPPGPAGPAISAAGPREDDPETASPPISVIALPPTTESALTLDFDLEGECPWLATFLPKPEREGEWGIPGLPEEILRGIFEAGLERLTIGARAFGPGTSNRGRREEIRIFEVTADLSSVKSVLERIVGEGGAREEKVPHGRLFHFGSEGKEETWLGIAPEKVCIVSEEEDLARGALTRLGPREGGGSHPLVLEPVAGAATWKEPLLLLRVYDPENRTDIYSPLFPPKSDATPQNRPLRVVGIRLGMARAREPAADLDVLTGDPDGARNYYHELLGFESRLKEPTPPGKGWIRFRLEVEEGRDWQFHMRLLSLFGYQIR